MGSSLTNTLPFSRIQYHISPFGRKIQNGIESFKGLEISPFDATKNIWDVADCFGKENNLERIKKDKTENPDKLIMIKGFAGTLKTGSACNQK